MRELPGHCVIKRVVYRPASGVILARGNMIHKFVTDRKEPEFKAAYDIAIEFLATVTMSPGDDIQVEFGNGRIHEWSWNSTKNTLYNHCVVNPEVSRTMQRINAEIARDNRDRDWAAARD